MKFNQNLYNLGDENIFLNITQKVKKFKEQNPNIKLLSLGIGDVSKPINHVVADAMKRAVDDLTDMSTFKGYGSYYGYDFLKQKILDNEYKDYNFTLEEIYISNGTKTDSTSILELFSLDAKILIFDPMYPIYRDGLTSMGRKCYTMALSEQNNFVPTIPKEKYDVIFLCSPSNPIGTALNKNDLEKWVKYALDNDAVIIYDNVYQSFVTSADVPPSIYSIEGAKKCAIEMRSFSKNASFSGVRCSYYIIPDELFPDVNSFWKKRTINRFNGADYIAQRGAEAVYNTESQEIIKNNIAYYKENLKLLCNCFDKCNFKYIGGKDSPYLWVKTKDNMSSWQMFDVFLKKLNIIIIPGIIFGENGDNYFRVSSLGNLTDTKKCIERINKYFSK